MCRTQGLVSFGTLLETEEDGVVLIVDYWSLWILSPEPCLLEEKELIHVEVGCEE
jgi:hypothetical protein